MTSRPRTVCLVGLIAGGHGGIPRYAVKLTQALDTLSPAFPQLRLTLLTTAAGADAVNPERLEVQVVAGRGRRLNAGPGRLLVEQLAARRCDADLLHFFDLSGPLLSPSRAFITTIHDLAPLEGFAPRRNFHKRRIYPWALRRAVAAVAVSAFSKAEAVRHVGADPEKIEVIHSGPGLFEDGAAPTPRGVEAVPYLLYVGSIDANKNLPLLVRAYAAADVEARLILAGRPREGEEDVRRAIEASGCAERIELRAQASDAEIDALYRGAVALVLPSLYEGFGFTPLEAMLRGCPVLASDIGAIREVSGDGAELLPPQDEQAWSAAMRRVVGDAGFRERLRAAGAATATRYSWERTGRGVLELLSSVEIGVAPSESPGSCR